MAHVRVVIGLACLGSPSVGWLSSSPARGVPTRLRPLRVVSEPPLNTRSLEPTPDDSDNTVLEQPGVFRATDDDETRLVAAVERGNFWELDRSPNASVPVHYSFVDGTKLRRTSAPASAPVVFLHGFGAGEFHFEGNMAAVAAATGRRCYGMDLVAQGRSWPRAREELAGLRVGADTWLTQLEKFLEEVVGERAVLAGNSLGGFLATVVAARRPDLVAGLFLLNPTPFWGFVREESRLWDARLPAPAGPRTLGALWFDALRDEKTVQRLLRQVYASPERCDDRLVRQILDAARSSSFGPEAFTSILFSPAAPETFEDALQTAFFDHDVPVALVFGREDPWVSPPWGQRAHRRLDRRAPYFELSPTGHCPHHESPLATNYLLCDWLETMPTLASDDATAVLDVRPNSGSSSTSDLWRPATSPTDRRVVVIREDDGRDVTIARVDGAPRNLVERAALAVWG